MHTAFLLPNFMDEVSTVKMEKNELKEAFQEAIKSWLDDKFAQFGKWSLGALAAASIAALTYFILTMNGWSKK